MLQSRCDFVRSTPHIFIHQQFLFLLLHIRPQWVGSCASLTTLLLCNVFAKNTAHGRSHFLVWKVVSESALADNFVMPPRKRPPVKRKPVDPDDRDGSIANALKTLEAKQRTSGTSIVGESQGPDRKGLIKKKEECRR